MDKTATHKINVIAKYHQKYLKLNNPAYTLYLIAINYGEIWK